MTLHQLRDFLEITEWATGNVGAYFLYGECNVLRQKMALNLMKGTTKTKDKELRLKTLPAPKKTYAHRSSRKNRLGDFLFDHNEKLRCVLGKICHEYPELIGYLNLNPPHDAQINILYFELDNGNMNERQLREKIEKYLEKYKGKRGIIVFIMATPYKKGNRPIEKIREDEKRRYEKLFYILRELIPDHPNRVLVAPYTKFLEDLKLSNHKGKEYNFSTILDHQTPTPEYRLVV